MKHRNFPTYIFESEYLCSIQTPFSQNDNFLKGSSKDIPADAG